jgi:hypothetical protein
MPRECNGYAKPVASLVTSFMRLNDSKFMLSLAFALASVAPAFGQTTGPKAAVIAFYKFDATHSQDFNRANIDARKRWLAADLYRRLINELAREKDYLKKNPGNKPYFEGLSFQPLDETCEVGGRRYRRTISYGTVTIKGEVGNVDVYFKYPKGCNLPDILYAVNMSKERGRWVIDDIRYIADNTSLVEDLDRKEY